MDTDTQMGTERETKKYQIQGGPAGPTHREFRGWSGGPAGP